MGASRVRKRIGALLLVVAMLIALAPGTALAAEPPSEVWVDDDFDSDTPGWGETRFASIQAGIDAVAPGGTVRVATGLYEESLTVGKTLVLLGAQADVDPRPDAGSSREPGGDGESVVRSSTEGLKITAPDVVVNGFSFESTTSSSSCNVVFAEGAAAPQILYNIVYNTNSSGASNEGIKVRDTGGAGAMVSYNYVFDIPSPGDGINFDRVTGGTISHNEVRNSGSENAAIYVYGSEKTTIEGNLVDTTTQNDGIKLGSKEGTDAAKTGGVIRNNVTRNTAQDGISVYMSDVLVEGNEVSGSTSENGAIYLAFGISNVTIRGNTICNNALKTHKHADAAGIMLEYRVNASTVTIEHNNIYANTPKGLTNKAASAVSALRNWWGDDQGPRHGSNPRLTGGDGVSGHIEFLPWLDAPYPGGTVCNAAYNVNADKWYFTIQAAIDDASPGDTVQVAAGTYNERLVIDRPIDLRGAQHGVDPTAKGARMAVARESRVDLAGLPLRNPNVLVEICSDVSDVSISGFSLIGSPTWHYADEAVVRAWRDDIVLKDNIIEGYVGVLYKGPGDGLTVSRNRLTVNKNGIVCQPGGGGDVTVSGNSISLGGSPQADAGPIYMTGIAGATVSGNTADGFSGAGIAGSNLTELNISENKLHGNYHGISIWGDSRKVTIAGNELSGSQHCGVSVKGQDITIKGNDILDNSDCGIYVATHVIETERVTISSNNLTGNGNYGVFATEDVTERIDAALNYWGHKSGPSGEGRGEGAAVSAGVDYAPWYMDPGMKQRSDAIKVVAQAQPAIAGRASGGGTFSYLDVATVKALPTVGGAFVNWTEDGVEVSTDPAYTFEVTDARALVANFALKQFTLTITKTGGGSTIPSVGTHSYDYGEYVPLAAFPEADWEFVRWVGPVAEARESETTIRIDGDMSVRTLFSSAEEPVAPEPEEPEGAEVLTYAAGEVDPELGGGVVLPDGMVVLDVPAGATATTTTFSVSELDADEAPEVPGTFTVAGKVVRVTAEDPGGNAVREFAEPLTITFYLTDEDVAGDWEGLVISYYDEELGWITLETTVDPETGMVTATFDHLTVFAVMRYAPSAVDYGARLVIMLIGDTRYAADHKLQTLDVAPFIENGRTFVPVRFLAEAFGADANWRPKDGPVEYVTLTRPDISVTIEIGSKLIAVTQGGEVTVVESDVAAFIRDGRTYLPFRAIAEAFGATVDFGPLDGPVKWVKFEQ